MRRKEKKDSTAGGRAGMQEGSGAQRQSHSSASSSYSGFINIAMGREGGGRAENPACGEEEFSNGCGETVGRDDSGWQRGKISALNYCFTRAVRGFQHLEDGRSFLLLYMSLTRKEASGREAGGGRRSSTSR